VLVQNNVEPSGRQLRQRPLQAHAEKLPLGCKTTAIPVRYRNIWIRELKTAE